METTIFQIDDILVSSEILTEYFCCDYPKCKGCCCIIGDSGAPLLEEECEALESEYPEYSPLMSPEGRETVSRKGFFEIDTDQDIVTPLVTGGGKCAYTLIDEGGHCYCAIERSYIAGGSRMKKPISCWLYPIRVSHLTSGLTALNLHRWELCREAFIKGRKEKVHVYEFLREPIIRLFSEEFYHCLEEAAKTLR